METTIWVIGCAFFLLGIFFVFHRRHMRARAASELRYPGESGTWILLFCAQGETEDKVMGEFVGTQEDAWDAAMEAVAGIVMESGDVVIGRYGVRLKEPTTPTTAAPAPPATPVAEI